MAHPPGIFDVAAISIETALDAQWPVTIGRNNDRIYFYDETTSLFTPRPGQANIATEGRFCDDERRRSPSQSYARTMTSVFASDDLAAIFDVFGRTGQ
ncbi:hypothetical protein AruPA_11690 [Acidiphilium sp. PA]|uniref:hypothetical protein n=1 Tax=Acidiphilium sp. PA TaxID=2871705 RepID=UPI00224415BA|nr:hypothetical protein [Acidiphilium sp. PA]MCW8307704.1 hypothetical protein [Acidiphilium sp. PA]